MRLFPNFVVMAPGDELDVKPMLRLALKHTGPISMRYPKAGLEQVGAARRAGRRGTLRVGPRVVEWGEDGCFIAFGTLLSNCVAAAAKLRAEGIHVGVINARFAKPLDKETILRAGRDAPRRGDGRGRHARRRVRARRCWRRRTPRAWTRATSSASACRTASSSIESDRNELLADLGLSRRTRLAAAVPEAPQGGGLKRTAGIEPGGSLRDRLDEPPGSSRRFPFTSPS